MTGGSSAGRMECSPTGSRGSLDGDATVSGRGVLRIQPAALYRFFLDKSFFYYDRCSIESNKQYGDMISKRQLTAHRTTNAGNASETHIPPTC